MTNMLTLFDLNQGYRHPFLPGIHYHEGVGDNPRTVTDLAMSQYSALLRRQPDWWVKYRDESVRAKWLNLAKLAQVTTVKTPSLSVEVELSEKQIEYIIDELAGYAILRDEDNDCQVSCFERIWESGTLFSSLENDTLRQSLLQLELLSTCTRDNDGITINLIDPTFHCLVYNQTLVSSNHGIPTPLPTPPNAMIYTICPHFALLPADVSVDKNGRASFLSYINNLHPEDHALHYVLLETYLTKFIPLFEHTLTDLHRNNPLSQRILGLYKYTVWEEPEPPEHSDDEEGWSAYECDMRHWVMNRPIQLPDVPDTGYPGGIESRKFTVSLRERRIQVIVETTETRLRPGRPNSPGTRWHVKGMQNERIVACGVHCLSAENISLTSVQFRMAVSYPRGFPAGDSGATSRTWGLSDGEACHQYIGEAVLRTGFSLVFPNIYQQRQTPFELIDKTREGWLTLLMFYLIDPDIQPIVSTSSVAPQQNQWIQRALEEALFPRIPIELIREIFSFAEGLMDLKEAEDHRDTLLGARASFRHANNSYHFCIPFDVWSGSEPSNHNP